VEEGGREGGREGEEPSVPSHSSSDLQWEHESGDSHSDEDEDEEEEEEGGRKGGREGEWPAEVLGTIHALGSGVDVLPVTDEKKLLEAVAELVQVSREGGREGGRKGG